MTFEEFYSQISDMNAVEFYERVGNFFLETAKGYEEKLNGIPGILRTPKVESHIRTKHERYHHHANAPIGASELLGITGKDNYTVRDHALIGHEEDPIFGLDVLRSVYGGLRELDIPLEDVLG